MELIRVDMEKCRKDGICVEVCPLSILSLDPEGVPMVVPGLDEHCIGCGHCVAACPHDALDNERNPLARHGVLPRYPVLDPHTAFTFLRSRRSIRRYRKAKVPRETLVDLLQIARYAPSGHNSQGLSYLLVDGEDSLKTISQIVVEWMRETVVSQPELAARLHMPGIIKASERGEDRILRNAPALIVATASKELRAAQITTYLALEYVEIYATTLGLGTCWAGFTQVCAQQHPALAKFLEIPEDHAVMGMLMAGYPLYHYYRLPERNPLEVRWFQGK